MPNRPAPPAPRPDASRAPRQITVEIARTDSAAEGTFEVTVVEPAFVLDLLLAAQREEPTLAFRYSCRVAMCGTCALRVDGVPVLACRTRVPASERVRLEPLAGLPVLKDLVVDTSPFWNAWRRAEAWFVERPDGEPVVLPEGDPRRHDVERGLDCIACGACWSACDLSRSNADFVGPAALNRAMVLVADPRDGARQQRLHAVSTAGGVTRCHYINGCSAACPKGLDPANAIRQLRRWSLGARR